LAISRVKERVAQGGHNIPEEVICRRYKVGLENLSKYQKVRIKISKKYIKTREHILSKTFAMRF
jgi:predicted ABC-type ATPase